MWRQVEFFVLTCLFFNSRLFQAAHEYHILPHEAAWPKKSSTELFLSECFSYPAFCTEEGGTYVLLEAFKLGSEILLSYITFTSINSYLIRNPTMYPVKTDHENQTQLYSSETLLLSY